MLAKLNEINPENRSKVLNGMLSAFEQKQSSLEQIKKIVGKFPEMTVSIIRSWINEPS